MLTEDPAVWITNLVEQKWQHTIDALKRLGRDVPHSANPRAAPAASTRSGGVEKNQVFMKIYEGGDEDSEPQSWGDSDRDVTSQWVLQLSVEGARAREAAESTRRVLDYLLALHRNRPHPDWDRIESWRFRTSEDYHDWQRMLCTINLARRGEVLPVPIVEEGA